MFDIIFISYDEPNADENWKLLKEIAPHAKRIHGIKGIAQAHIEAAKEVSTSHFFTVDGDNVVCDDFDWERIVDFQKDDKRIHVWRAENPVNGLVYGYGGIKLWPTNHVENIKEYAVDFTTSVATHGFKVQNTIASTTVFNTSAYNAWKSGYRECTKLASGIIHNADERSLNRLMVWMSVGADVQYGYECILGARLGAHNGLFHSDEKALFHINDFDTCKSLFESLEGTPTMEQDPMFGAEIIEKNLNRELVLYDPKQSRVFKELMYRI